MNSNLLNRVFLKVNTIPGSIYNYANLKLQYSCEIHLNVHDADLRDKFLRGL